MNNAGIQHVAPIEHFPDDKYEAIIGLNLNAAFYTTKHTIGKMKQANWGRIINIASAHGKVASANKSAYVAAKHGIVGFGVLWIIIYDTVAGPTNRHLITRHIVKISKTLPINPYQFRPN